MKRLLKHIEVSMDNFKIKKKFYIIYILCMLLPLILTDSVIIYIVIHSEQVSRRHEMENIANAVHYNLYNGIDSAAELGKSIYMNKYINEFLDKKYSSSLDYVISYQNFFKDTLLENSVGIDNVMITMYSENDTIVNGGEFSRLEMIKESEWYEYLKNSGLDTALYFDYNESNSPAVEAKRKIMFLKKLNFYGEAGIEKVLKIELDYSSMTRNLTKMNYATPVYICWNDQIVLSNGKHASVGKDFEPFEEEDKVGYAQDMSLYGIDLKIYVLKSEVKSLTQIIRNFPIILLLILINAVLPIIMVRGFNRSFTVRLGELSEAFKNVENEHLVEIENARGKDEIGSLMRSYNIMAARINSLIQIVYKNRLQEQEMMVARQNAELLALHSQINPHFLFNALESIRMHSIIKREMETADMVEKLAIMQRQYVEWGNDSVDIGKEMDFVRAYLALQKYRFGDRLSYELDVEEGCNDLKIPKLSVVTFVENSCVHGIESKTTPGWIFVRIYRKSEWLYLEVEDTGSSMEEEVVAELLAKMKNASIEMLKNKGRVGMVNACLRLKMISLDEVQFEVDAEAGVGTMVQIRVPLKYV